MNARKHHLIHILALILLAVIFMSVMVSSNLLLRGQRFDLSEHKLWTLTESSRKVLQEIDEPITLRFFFSRDLAQQFPAVRAHGQRVRDLLGEIERHANGKIQIEYIEPEPFSEDEDRALALGLRPAPLNEDRLLYFGLAGANSVDGIETVPFFTLERAHNLEYDLIRMVHALAMREKPMLGIVTSLPLDTGMGGLPAALAGQARPFLIYRQLLDHFQLEFLEQNFAQVPPRINTLMIAHPKKLGKKTLYAIDQFVMRGGRLLVFVDPYAEISQKTSAQGKPIRGLARSSNLAPLLAAWGARFDPDDIVADRALAQSVAVRDQMRAQSDNFVTRDYVLWLAAARAAFAADEPVTNGLSVINLATSGHFTPVTGREKNFHPLITSSDDAMLVSPRFIQGRTPDDLLAAFKPTGQIYVLAARLSGHLPSAFAGRPKVKSRKRKSPPHISRTKKPAHIIIVADSDLFEDRFWAHRQRYSDTEIATPFADNATFIINVIDNLMGSQALISLRSRKRQNRPFTHVDRLRARASKQLAAQEHQLREKISAIEAMLVKMDDRSSAAAPQAAQKSMTALRRDLLASRRSLRDVRRALNQDIERLGIWVRFFNIAFMPLVLIMIFLLWPWIKSKWAKSRTQ